ncbi:MAG: tRNA (adenosine(37)-N6)-dimethylallyltransferase MiaA [Dehalococcoidia bacterium]|jgi:tRNA dimethylallyltransferase
MKCLVAIVGPTAVGKSRLGIGIAKQFSGEIVNADSRQIYKYMDIGTAKPGAADRGTVPHHMLDIIFPDQPYSLAHFQASAQLCISDIQDRGGLPVLVGGSGQYIWSVLEGWNIPAVEPDPVYREEMARRAETEGVESLYRELEEMDPAGAALILPHNLRRIVRALEIHRKTGMLPSSLREKKGLPYPVLIIGLTAERERLYSLIDRRTDDMVAAGFVNEVKKLLKMGYDSGLPAMSSLGYRQMIGHLSGRISLEEAVQIIKYETHRFARSQNAWFRTSDDRISWFETEGEYTEKIIEKTRGLLEKIG